VLQPRVRRRLAGPWATLVALAQTWWPDVFIAACDPVNPTLVVLAVRALRRLGYGRTSYEGAPMRRSSLTVTI
jgi:hypothetical protein